MELRIAPKYSLCKHGPNCRRNGIGKCGFAHSLAEVSLPGHFLSSKVWVDEAHVSGGRASPDMFFGQMYTFNQQQRILSYVACTEPPYPSWVNLYLWLFRHAKYIPDHQRDLGWYGLVEELCAAHLVKDDGMFCSDAESLLEWNAPWLYCKDILGVDFRERMKYRLGCAVEYDVMVAVGDFPNADVYREGTSMHWGRYSKDYLNVSVADRFVLLAESHPPHPGWAWVAKYPSVKVYGWVPRGLLEYTHQTVYIEGAKIADVCVQPLTDSNVSTVNDCQFELGRVCPDGTDLTQYSNVAVCISDGSTDDACGIAAASVCILPDESIVWDEPGAAIKMYAKGSATAELVGIAFSLQALLVNVGHFETAVVYTDSAVCIHYIGDSIRGGEEPSSDDGWKLYPLILYVRDQVLQLQHLNKYILVKKLLREQNVADSMAKHYLRDERDKGWPRMESIERIDRVPGLSACIQQVAQLTYMVASGCRISYFGDSGQSRNNAGSMHADTRCAMHKLLEYGAVDSSGSSAGQ